MKSLVSYHLFFDKKSKKKSSVYIINQKKQKSKKKAKAARINQSKKSIKIFGKII